MTTRSIRFGAVTLAFALLAAACGDDSSSDATPAPATAAPAPAATAMPVPDATAAPMPSKLGVAVIFVSPGERIVGETPRGPTLSGIDRYMSVFREEQGLEARPFDGRG